jgi:hypothetical protein
MKPLVPQLIGLALALSAGAAVAQFGNPSEPPRPPANVPGRPQPQAPPQGQPQSQGQPYALPPGPAIPRPGAIQSEELPPPSGSQSATLPQGGAATPPGQLPPPGQRQPRPGPAPTAPAAAAPAPPPAADVVTVPPPQRISNPTAVFSGLDKITGRITAFNAAIGETVQFGALQVTARACYSRPPTETPLTDGFVEVDEVTLQGEVRRIFTGWMFAASPGLHAVEHPIYDVWLVDCKGAAQAVADTQPTIPAAAPSRQGQRQATPQQRQQSRQNLPAGR